MAKVFITTQTKREATESHEIEIRTLSKLLAHADDKTQAEFFEGFYLDLIEACGGEKSNAMTQLLFVRDRVPTVVSKFYAEGML